MNLHLASENRRLLIFSAIYCKKFLFDCIMWNFSLFQSLKPVPLVSVPVLETDVLDKECCCMSLHNMLRSVHVVGDSGPRVVLKFTDSGELN